MQLVLSKKQYTCFTITSILYELFQYGIRNTIIISILLQPLITDQNTIWGHIIHIIYVLLHIGGLSILMQTATTYLYNKHKAYIKEQVSQEYNKIYMYNEKNSILNTQKDTLFIQDLHPLLLAQVQTLSLSYNILLQVIIITIILFYHLKKTLKIIILPLGYVLVFVLTHLFSIKNKTLENISKKYIVNYINLLLLIVVFPKIASIDHILLTLYIAIILNTNFTGWYAFYENNTKIQNILNNCDLPNSDSKINNYSVINAPAYDISIRQYFLLQSQVDDDIILSALNKLNLIPILEKIESSDILSINLNKLNIANKTKISIARAILHKNNTLIYNKQQVDDKIIEELQPMLLSQYKITVKNLYK